MNANKTIKICCLICLPLVLLFLLGVWASSYFSGDDYRCRRDLRLAEKCYEAGKYAEAVYYCTAVLERDNTLVEAYRLYADACLAQDKCTEAVQALIDGMEATGAEELSEREAYLREHIVAAGKEDVHYDADGNVVYRREAEYDGNGNETRCVRYDADGSLAGWYESQYDGEGRMVKFVSYHAGNVIFQWKEYEYDERGNQIRRESYTPDGVLYKWEESEFNEQNNLTRYVSYDEDGSIVGQRVFQYEYDERGSQIKCMSYLADGSLDEWQETEYDENGRPTICTSYGADKSVTGWKEYEYDERGSQIKCVNYDAGGSPDGWKEWEYDEDGRLVAETTYDENGNLFLCLEYDERGNQTKYVRYSAGEIEIIAEDEYDVLNGAISGSTGDGTAIADRYTCSYQYHFSQ